jgi:hypothetical protein
VTEVKPINSIRSLTRGGLGLLSLWLLAAMPGNAADALRLHPENPHYLLFRGKPTLIIASGEHYGAVLNLDFDYTRYLTTLSQEGLNGTRTWVGAYCEPYGAFGIMRNTLAPRPNRFISPWARGRQPGYQNGGNRFDLSKWDNAYFKRLNDFLYQAGKRGIIVEVNLFCPFYEESMWQLSPMNPLNNVNRFGAIGRTNVYTLDKNNNLLDVQEALTRKVVTELNRFDNLYYEICNEPYFGGVTLEWQRHIAGVIVQTENGLGKRHLISRNIANEKAKVQDPEPALSILNFHYASPPDAVALNYDLNRVIGDNETGFRGTNDAPYRMEGWDFIVAGGGLFNNLDYSFTAGHEDGTFAPPASQPGGGGPALRRQLRFLGEFMRHFDLVHLQPLPALVVGGVPAGMTARALGQPGQDYIIYLRTAPQRNDNAHPPAAKLAEGQVVLEAALPEGEFDAQWFNPKDASLLRSEHVAAAANPMKLSAPAFEDDIVLAIRRGGTAPIAKAPQTARLVASPPPQTEPIPVTPPSKAEPVLVAPPPQMEAVPTTPPPQTEPTPVAPPLKAEPVPVAPPLQKEPVPAAPPRTEPIPAPQPGPATPAAPPPEPLPLPSQGVSDAAYRIHAWETILTTAPGSRKISYATVPEGASHALRQQIRFLNDFFRRHDPGKMEQANDLISGGLPAGIIPRILRSPAQDYVIYLRRTPQGAGETETPQPGRANGQLTLDVTLPPGEFNARWFDTREGLTLFSEHFRKGEGVHQLVVPVFQNDIVVAIHATAVAKAKKEVTAASSPRPTTPEPKLPKPLPAPPLGANDANSRMAAWTFTFGAGQSNGVGTAAGARTGGPFGLSPAELREASRALRQQLRSLDRFAVRFDLRHMEPGEGIVTGGVPEGMLARSLAGRNREYAIYLRPAPRQQETGTPPQTVFTNGQLVLELALPPGQYAAQWFDTKSGSMLPSEDFTQGQPVSKLPSPAFQDDIALIIREMKPVVRNTKTPPKSKKEPPAEPAVAGREGVQKPLMSPKAQSDVSLPMTAVAEEAKAKAVTAPPPQIETTEAKPPTPPPAQIEAAEAKLSAPPPAQVETAEAKPSAPPPPRTEMAKPKPVAPPQARTEAAKTKAVAPAPPRAEPAAPKSTAVPRVWIDTAHPPPSVVPSPVRSELPGPKAATPSQTRTEAAREKAVAPTPSRTEPATPKSTSVPRVWVDTAHPPPSVVPSPVRSELPGPKAAPPPQTRTKAAREKTVTPPPSRPQTAKPKTTTVPRVWIDPEFAPKHPRQSSGVRAPGQARIAPPARTATPGANTPGRAPRQSVRAPQSRQGSVESPATTRMDAWDLVLSGGAPPKNLVQSIASGRATAGASAAGAALLRTQLRFLSDFARRFDIARMQKERTLITGPLSAGMTARVLVKPGQDYIVYLRPTGPQPRGNGRSGAVSRNRQTVLDLNLPAGRYTYEWLDPSRTLPINYQQLTHSGGVARLAVPPFRVDAVLALRRQ